MSYNIAGSNMQKAGLCPHGLPVGACPICSGGGGGGINKMDRNTRRHAGEMTWNECYAIGQMMKAAQARKEMALTQQQNAQMQNQQIQQAAIRFANVISNIRNVIMNNPIAKSVEKVADKVQQGFNKMVTTFANFAKPIANFIQEIKNKIIDISDKIAAIFGEENLAKLKKAGEFIERSKKKILSLFGFIDETKEEEETSEEVKKEEKRVSFIQKLRKNLNLIKEDENDS